MSVRQSITSPQDLSVCYAGLCRIGNVYACYVCYAQYERDRPAMHARQFQDPGYVWRAAVGRLLIFKGVLFLSLKD